MQLQFRSIRILFLSFGISGYLQCFSTEHPGSIGFIENKNQWPSDVRFSAQVRGGQMHIATNSFRYYLIDKKRLEELHDHSHAGVPDGGSSENIGGHFVETTFIGANRNSEAFPFGKSDHYYNYFIGDDPSRWAPRAYAYDGMLLKSFYKDIDLKVYSVGENVKYDFIVSPYADPSQIVLQYNGWESLRLDNGSLYVGTSLGDIIEKRPIAYQIINGQKIFIACEFHLANNIVTFCLDEGYDPCYELVIDPMLIFSTYSGSTADNWGSTATPGERGTLYSAGVTNQVTAGGSYPATPGAFQRNYGGNYDIGILKYDSTGGQLLYATFLGGSGNESAHSLIVNQNHELVVMGTTSSNNFPTTPGAIDRTFNGGSPAQNVIQYIGSDLIVARISPDGSVLLGATYLGGSQNDGMNPRGVLTKNYGDELRGDVLTDSDNNIYISSVSSSINFPMVNSIDATYNAGETDAILVKLNSQLTQIVFSTYIGGSGADASHTIKRDSQGNIFIGGGTTSVDFPTTVGAYRKNFMGVADGWIAKVAPDGSSILNATLTGTAAFDQVYVLEIDKFDDPYVYGQTDNRANLFPIVPLTVYRNRKSGQFIQKFNKTLSSVSISTTVGSGSGLPDISPTAFLVNDCGNIYISGWGGSRINESVPDVFWQFPLLRFQMPTSADAYQRRNNGADFYFMVLTDNAEKFLYGSYMGGTQSATHVDGGTSRFDKRGIVYHAVCSGCAAFNLAGQPTSDFPTTPGAWSSTNRSQNCNNAAFKFDLSSLSARIQTNSSTFTSPGLTVVCKPDVLAFENQSIGGESFIWDFGDRSRVITRDTLPIIHDYAEPGQYIVKLKAFDPGTCKEVDSTAVRVYVYEPQSEVQDDDDLCFGASYQLDANGGVQYEWKVKGGEVFSTLDDPIVNPGDTTSYIVKITEASGCVKTDTVTLNVIDKVKPEFEYVRKTDCSSIPTLFVKNMTDSLSASDQMFFDFGDGATSDLSEVTHAYQNDGLYTIKLVSVREYCVFEKSETIPMFKVVFPNVITPDATADKNDRFVVQFGSTEGVTPADYGFKVSVKVYNRWGKILFETDDYQYDWSAEDLAAGIYYYDVEVQDHASCRSWLHVIR